MGGKKKETRSSKLDGIQTEIIFGQIIREKRTELGLSQRELAAQSELERSSIAYVELGYRHPSLSTIIELALALGTRPSELLAEMEQRMKYDQLLKQ